jgi:hypothetical protein
MPRWHHGPHAGWLCAALLVMVYLGGLAGCAMLTDVATPAPGRSLDGGRAEMEDLRAAVEQLHAAVSQLGAGLRERDTLLGQLTARLQALEQDVAKHPRPAGRREVLAAMDPLPALDSLAQRLREVERRLTAMETRSPEASRVDVPREPTRQPAPAGRATARPGGPRLQPGLTQAEVRDLLGEPVRVEATPRFVFWYYEHEAYVVFEQGTGRVDGWLGVSP